MKINKGDNYLNNKMLETINKVKSNWTKDLIIRYLYIKLAPNFQRDLLYFLASEEEKLKQYKQGFVNRFPNIVCSTLADFYVKIFNDFGINAKKVIANSAKIPLFAIVVEGDIGFYYLDPLSDLFSNQYGLKPFFFGITPKYKTINSQYPNLTKLPKEYLDELDDTLEIEYLDEYFEDLHNRLVHRNNANEFFGLPRNHREDLKERKINLIKENYINIGNVDGIFERAQLYKYLDDRIMNHMEKQYIRIRIEGGGSNPQIIYEEKSYGIATFYKEEKQDGKYVLLKTNDNRQSTF